MLQKLPNPYVPEFPYEELRRFHGSAAIANSTVVATNNHAHYVPVSFPVDALLYSMRTIGGNTTGNYDLAFYDENYVRLAAKGSTAMAATVLELTFTTDIAVRAGALYYAAVALSSSAGQLLRPGYGLTSGINDQRNVGHFMQASALPLPDPAVPSMATLYGNCPLFAFGVR